MKSPQPSTPISRCLLGAAVVSAGLGLSSTTQAVIVANSRIYPQVDESPTNAQFVTVSGPGTINSSGQTGSGFFYGSENISRFETLPGYRTVQTFPAALNNLSTAKALDFTGDGSVDIRFSANVSTGGSLITGGTFLTSGGNGIRLQPANETAFTFTIEFGELTPIPDTTNSEFTLNQGVSAVGFSLNGLFSRLVDNTATVSFYSSSGLLSSVVLNGSIGGDPGSDNSGSNNRWTFVSYENDTGLVANNVSYVTVSFTTWQNDNANLNAILAIDDLGYTTASLIPEPSTAAALLGLGALGFASAGRRRRR